MGHPLARPFPKIQDGPASGGFVDQPPATESDQDPENLNVDDVRCDLLWVGREPLEYPDPKWAVDERFDEARCIRDEH